MEEEDRLLWQCQGAKEDVCWSLQSMENSPSIGPKYRLLHAETMKTIGDWIFEDILCQWGTLCEIVTNNGPAFIKVLAYLEKQCHVQHIHISGYNSGANGITECVHFNV